MIPNISDSTLLMIWAAGTVFLFAITFADALLEIVPWRADLLRRVAHTRLWRMLERQGIPTAVYVRSAPLRMIDAHIRTCEACGNKRSCAALLRQHQGDNFWFCPSGADIRALRGQLAGRDTPHSTHE